MNKVSENLKFLAYLQEEKEQEYGEAYKRKGRAMLAILGGGIALNTEDDFNRYSILEFMVSKIIRYGSNFHDGGHKDSLDDISVYAQMLSCLDEELKNK